MATSQLTIDPSFAESERAIAEQQARKKLIIGIVTVALLSVVCLGAAINRLAMTMSLSLIWIGTLIQVLVDVSRWRFFRRAPAADAFRDLQQPEEEFPAGSVQWAIAPGAGTSSASDLQRTAVGRAAIVLAGCALLSVLPLLVLTWIDPSALRITSAAGTGWRVNAILVACLILVNAWAMARHASWWWRLSRATPDDAVRQLQSRSERLQQRRVDRDTVVFFMIVAFVVLFVLSLTFKKPFF